MTAKVFIDGAHGTTGLEIRERLEGRAEVELMVLPADRRRDPEARREALNSADAVVLCLPDDAAREAVGLIENAKVKVIDASTAHRTAEGWTYGFPELAAEQRQALADARRISNPGCWPTGFLALVRPLVEVGLVPEVWPLTVHGVSGYSGGGKAMIAEFEDKADPSYVQTAYRQYGLQLGHKHITEMRTHSGLEYDPLFSPSVGRFYRGMLVEVPLQLWTLPQQPSREDVHSVLREAYAGEALIEVASLQEADGTKTLDAEILAGTNRLKLFVFGAEGVEQVRLVAALDNLGKGASGAAVQNLNIAMGWDETAGLL
jgi:N-acetyl-gamma-glutamyl-phosphate reductase